MTRPCGKAEYMFLDMHKGMLECWHCMATYPVHLPCPVTMTLVMMKEWRRMHKRCRYQPGISRCEAQHGRAR